MREQFAAYLQYLPSVRAYLKETGTHLEDRCLFIEYPLTAYQFNVAKIIHENPFVKSFRENLCLLMAMACTTAGKARGSTVRYQHKKAEVFVVPN